VTSLGEYLKRERTAQKVSLADLSRVTKIPMRMLTLLESDQVDALPAPVFVRGFVKAYARHLRLDQHMALGELEKWNEAQKAPHLELASSGRAGRGALPLHLGSRAGGVALLVLVVAGRWLN
jgi:cytoskeletal protein RodZ